MRYFGRRAGNAATAAAAIAATVGAGADALHLLRQHQALRRRQLVPERQICVVRTCGGHIVIEWTA